MGKLTWRIPEYLLLKGVEASPEFAALAEEGWWKAATQLLTDKYLAELSAPFGAESDGDFEMRRGLQQRAHDLVPYLAETEIQHKKRLHTIAKVSASY